MKWLIAVFAILSLVSSLSAQALILDCRSHSNPLNGYMVFLTEKEGRLQAVENQELAGPVLWGEFRSPPDGYLYVLRMSLTDNNMPSFYELWIPEPHDPEDIRAWFFDYGPTFRTPKDSVGVKGLHCTVVSEPIPRIFRSEI